MPFGERLYFYNKGISFMIKGDSFGLIAISFDGLRLGLIEEIVGLVIFVRILKGF